MLLQIPDVLTLEQVSQARQLLDASEWVDGRVTAGHQSARAKDNTQLEIIGGNLNGQRLDVAGVETLAKLPSLDELRGKIVGLIQAPATKIAGVLAAPAAQLARVLAAKAKQGEAA